jgi:response regulator RpfG family c-di-GMP phosphodiesterase
VDQLVGKSAVDKPLVLCVDDEPNVLEGVKRHLRRGFTVVTAQGGAAGLRAIADDAFAAVVSDLRMPGMDGIEFLGQVRERSPNTTRILLTGNADLSAAVAAVNEGNIFRFLTKPAPPEVLKAAVTRAVEQHRLVTAERELLERTLHGSVQMLTNALALASPETFGRVNLVTRRAGEVAAALGSPERWKMEMAAMVSRVAAVTIPESTLARAEGTAQLTAEEHDMISRLPEVAEQLLADIPRLEEVREILRNQQEPYTSDGSDDNGPPVGARILRAVLDLDGLEARGISTSAAVQELRSRSGVYDPAVVAALVEGIGQRSGEQDIRLVPVSGLQVGWLLLDPVRTTDGRLLMADGQEVTIGLLERLRNVSTNLKIAEPLRVQVPQAGLDVSGELRR